MTESQQAHLLDKVDGFGRFTGRSSVYFVITAHDGGGTFSNGFSEGQHISFVHRSVWDGVTEDLASVARGVATVRITLKRRKSKLDCSLRSLEYTHDS